jgi:hypothetical protein
MYRVVHQLGRRYSYLFDHQFLLQRERTRLRERPGCLSVGERN